MSKPKEIFLPSLDREIGAVHPINQVKFELVKLLTSFGFEVAEGPEIESEEYNFDMLNIPATPPAREMHDTFYVDGMKRVLAWMFYLNTVTDDGGTYFDNYDLTLNAVEGRCVIWPAYWTHMHRGIVSKTESKYIVTGWFSFIDNV